MATSIQKQSDKKITLLVDEREHAAILAGLRCYQIFYHDGFPEGVEEIASNDESFDPMDTDEINTLAEQINVED